MMSCSVISGFLLSKQKRIEMGSMFTINSSNQLCKSLSLNFDGNMCFWTYPVAQQSKTKIENMHLATEASNALGFILHIEASLCFNGKPRMEQPHRSPSESETERKHSNIGWSLMEESIASELVNAISHRTRQTGLHWILVVCMWRTMWIDHQRMDGDGWSRWYVAVGAETQSGWV